MKAISSETNRVLLENFILISDCLDIQRYIVTRYHGFYPGYTSLYMVYPGMCM